MNKKTSLLMVFLVAIFSAHAVVATQTPLLSPSEFLTVADSPAASFVTADGPHFYLNGRPFYFAGANNYYLFYEDWPQVLEVLDDAKAMNLTVIRTWGFSDGPTSSITKSPFQSAPGVYNETTFRRMDQIIKEAGNRGLKLMIPLVNNWDDFGGMCQYVDWCNATIPNYNLCDPLGEPGSGATAHDAFYTNSCTKDYYKDYVNYFLNRVNTLTGVKYKDDPTIFAWQLANEPRARSDTSGQTLYSWIDEMSATIKSIDPNHLVTTGEDGFYLNRSSEYGFDGYDGQDFIAHHQIPTIDFASMHLYDWTDYFSQLDNMLLWIDQHVIDAQTLIGKPVTLNEFGFKQPGRDANLQAVYDRMEEVSLNGDLFWILCDDTYPDFDGFCVYYPRDTSTTSIITAHGTAMKEETDTNHLPLINPISKIIVNEGQAITVVVLAADGDGNPLTYSIDDSRYSRNGNIFTWQTGEGDAGIYSPTVTVNDGSPLSVTASFDVVVREDIPCTVPTDNMVIKGNVIFCLDIYELPNGIDVGTDGVTIDCRGSILVGNESTSGIYSNYDNGTIKNCELQHYTTGIYLNYAVNNNIDNNKITDMKLYGIYLNRGSGNNITNNIIGPTANYVGLQPFGASNTLVMYNEISGHDKGIYNDAQGSVYHYNNIRNNGAWNFYNAGDDFVDAEYNWWGTTDPGEIERKIRDCNESSFAGCVDYEPYLLQPFNTISLVEGWNLISTPVTLEDPSIPAALSAIAGKYSAIYAYIDGDWLSFDPSKLLPLVPNADFELDDDGDGKPDLWSGTTGAIFRDEEIAVAGASLRLEAGQNYIAQSDFIPVVRTEIYTLSNYLKLDNEKGTFYVQIELYNSAKTQIRCCITLSGGSYSEDIGDFTEQRYTIDMSQYDPATAYIRIVYKWFSSITTPEGMVWVDSVLLLPSANTLTEIRPEYGYWIKMTENATVEFGGLHPFDDITANLAAGWNLVGYSSWEERPVEEVFGPIMSQIERILTYDPLDVGQEWKSYDPDKPPFLNTLTTIEPGKGYWIKAKSSLSFTSFIEDWESGAISSDWTMSGTNQYRTKVTSSDGPRGTYHLLMEDTFIDGTFSLNELTTAIDLTSTLGISLGFFQRDINDRPDTCPTSWSGRTNGDCVAFTCDGTTWYRIVDLSGELSTYLYTEKTYDIFADPHFCSELNSSFAIRFQQYDNINKGMVFDDIRISYWKAAEGTSALAREAQEALQRVVPPLSTVNQEEKNEIKREEG